MRFLVAMPLYNEERYIERVLRCAMKFADDILVVNDGSSDQGAQKARAMGVEVIDHPTNYGYGRALSDAFAYAAGKGYDVVITMDADLQDDPAAIPEMLAKLDEGYDLVSGWKKKRYDPLSFKLPSKLWNSVTSVMSGVKLHDFNCGFKAYRADVAKSLDIYGDRHRYLPALAHWDGFRVTEIPVPHHPRRFGKSKYGFGKFFNGVMDMLTLLFLKRYLKSPLHFFGLLGLVLIVLGSGILLAFGIQWAMTGGLHVRPLMLLSMGAIIMGIQFVSFGFLAEMITHMAPKDTYKIRDRIE